MNKSDAFSLVEVILVLAILGIIIAIVVPTLISYKGLVEENVCATNRKTIEQHYKFFLVENEHNDIIFTQFLMENFDIVCPAGGSITYDDSKVKCTIHKDDSNKGEEDDSSDDEVPWL